MNTDDMHVLAAAYTLDAVEIDERREFETHLETCPACLLEVAEFYETVGRLGSAAAELPPARLRVNVLNQIHNTRQATPLPRTEATISRFTRLRRSASTWVAAAAVIVAIAAGGYAWHEHQKPPQTQVVQSAVSRVVTAPDATAKDFPIKGRGRVTVVRAASTGEAVMIPHLRTPPTGKVYQYWVIVPGPTPTSKPKAILRRPVATGKPQLINAVRSTDILAVSIEKTGGAKQPTTVILVAPPS
jgi:anti-sigma-K factor RskA